MGYKEVSITTLSLTEITLTRFSILALTITVKSEKFKSTLHNLLNPLTF